MTGVPKYSGEGQGSKARAALWVSPWPRTARPHQGRAPTHIPHCSLGQPRKLVLKWFSWRHKGLLTSLMPPFNTELFHILSRLCFYSEWQGTFPLGKLEKCFYFFLFFFFLSSFSVSIYFSPETQGWWWQLRRQEQCLAGIKAGAFPGTWGW